MGADLRPRPRQGAHAARRRVGGCFVRGIARSGLAAGVLVLTLLALSAPAGAATLRVAVAANFQAVAAELAMAFERGSAHRVRLSTGSTGVLYAQIRQGAPFDVFLAADAERPRKLEADGVAVAGSRFTYALGRLALWNGGRGAPVSEARLHEADGARLAIANPRLAPYGVAARDALSALGLLETLRPRLVMGQSVAQAHQFVASGNTTLGFVALAQVVDGPAGDRWVVPARLHGPIRQQAVRLSDAPGARAFTAFLRGESAAALIRGRGYALP